MECIFFLKKYHVAVGRKSRWSVFQENVFLRANRMFSDLDLFVLAELI